MKLWPSKKKDAPARKSIGGRFVSWMRARFDAAQTTKDNAKHWGAAEFLSADRLHWKFFQNGETSADMPLLKALSLFP